MTAMKETTMNDNINAVLTTAELRKRWKCSRNSILALVHAGELAAFRITSNSYRFSLDEIRRFESQRAA